MDHSRHTNRPEVILEYNNDLSKYLNYHITRLENTDHFSKKNKFAHDICKDVKKFINENKQHLISEYLQKKAASDKYKEHFGNTPIGPTRGNGEGGSSTSAATWSAGGYSAHNDGPDPQGWTLWPR